ncbi:MAG: insulinase family protein [Phycisphaerae bacterium]|nr:insulinase family protein [Phycisphaerae bacterium]
MHRLSRIAVTAFVVAAMIQFTAPARAEKGAVPPPKKITEVEGITEYQLGNGMKVMLFPDASKPTVTVNATYFVGSRHEGYGETGMAHLLEHMVFKGCPKFPQVWKALQDHGAQFNGTTWFDRTNYFETLAATEENLDFALELEADRMVNSFIAKKDLDSEFSVVRNEFEMGENNPLGVLSERMASTAFLWHNYGKSTIGSREDIERVPIHRLQAFYRKYYQPDNAMLVVAGKFDPQRTLARINELFGSIPKPDRTLDPTYTVEPTQDGEREVILHRVGDVQAVGALYHICAGSHPDMPALEVLEHVLTADQTGRLYKALVEPQLATRIRGNAFALAEPGMFELMAEVRLDKPLDQVRETMMGVLDGLGSGDFTPEEVDRARNALLKQIELIQRDSGRVGVMLSEFAAMGDWRLMFLYRDRVEKITPADVKRVAAAYFKPSNRTVGIFTPTKQPDRTIVPPIPDVASMLKDYRGREAFVQGETIEATPASIESRTTRLELPFGMKAALLPKKTRGRQVSVVLNLHYGSEADFQNKVDAAEFIGPMLMRGTAKHTRRQIQDAFDKLKAQVFVGGGGGGGGRRMRGMAGSAGPGTISVNIETNRKNLNDVLTLVGEILKESTFPEKEFEKLRKQQLADAEQAQSEPMILAMTELRRRLNPVPVNDVRYTPTIAEKIERLKKVNIEDVKKLYQELLGAGHSEIAIVGDFDVSDVKTQIEGMFKDWKSPRPFQRIAMPYHETKPDTAVFNTPDKANSLIGMAMSLPIRDDDPDYPALTMGNFILGGNANSRLLNRLRQKEGYSYGCGSMVQASSHERTAAFMAYGICAPQNAEKAINAAREEIERLIKEGVSEKELADAKKAYFEQVKIQLADDDGVANMLARQTYVGRTMKFTEDQLKAIEQLTTDDVNRVIRKYLSAEKLFVIRAGDFTKPAEKEQS